MSTPTFNFGQGGQAAEQASEEMAPKGSLFRRTEYFPKMEKGEHIFGHYVTDHQQWRYATVHRMVPTKPKPADWPSDRKYPEAVTAVCRYDKAFGGYYKDCWVCDQKIQNSYGKVIKPSVRVWAVLALRQEVLATQAHVDANIVIDGKAVTQEMIGRRIGFTDVTRDIEVGVKDANGEFMKDSEGKYITEKKREIALVLVNKSTYNFFSGLTALVGIYGGTIADRDFAIVQRNESNSKDVEWEHQSIAETPDLKPGTEKWKRYEDALVEQGLTDADIVTMLTERSSDEFYGKFIDPTKAVPKTERRGGDSSAQQGSTGSVAQQQPAAAQANDSDPDPDVLAQMAARIKGGAAPTASAPAAEQSQAQSAPTATPQAVPAGVVVPD